MLRTLTITAVLASPALAESNVDPAHAFTWGENIGWINWRDADDADAGVELSPDGEFLSGFAWGENVGWINLGDGTGPYSNLDGASAGVNLLPSGYLDGFAWGENIGWVNFSTEATLGAEGARFDEVENRLRGYAWGENVGWINLNDDTHYVGFATLCPADFTGSDDVGSVDLAFLLAAWNAAGGPADIDGSGLVDSLDLAALLAAWGPCP